MKWILSFAIFLCPMVSLAQCSSIPLSYCGITNTNSYSTAAPTIGAAGGGATNAILNATGGRWGLYEWSTGNGAWAQVGTYGTTKVCTTPTNSDASATAPPLYICATGVSANTFQVANFTLYHDAHVGTTSNPTNQYIVTVGGQSATTAVRFWAAYITDQTNATIAVSDTPAGNTAAIRFSSVASDTNFMLVLCNAGTCNATSTGVAGDANIHQFSVSLNDATGTATGCVDSTCVTGTTDYPATSSTSPAGMLLDNTTTTSKSMSVARIYWSTIK